MKRAELIKRLRKLAKQRGVTFGIDEGGRGPHAKVWLGTRTLPLPRHTEINELTAKSILKHFERED